MHYGNRSRRFTGSPAKNNSGSVTGFRLAYYGRGEATGSTNTQEEPDSDIVIKLEDDSVFDMAYGVINDEPITPEQRERATYIGQEPLDRIKKTAETAGTAAAEATINISHIPPVVKSDLLN